MFLARKTSRTGRKTQVPAVDELSSLAGGLLEGWRGFVASSTPRLTRGGDLPNRVRAFWLCNKEHQIAEACPEVLKELQYKLSRQGIQVARAVRWADRKAKGASPGRRDPKTVHKLRVEFLQRIQENPYKENPKSWDSHPEKDTTTTGTSGSGKEVGGVHQ